MAKQVTGRIAGLVAAVVLTISGAAAVLFAIRITAYMDFGFLGIAAWLVISVFGLALGTLGILGLMSWATTSKARH